MKKILPILIAFPFLLISCEETLDEITTLATFKSTISGDVEKQFDGTAAFVHVISENSTPNGSLLTILLTHVTNQDELISLNISNLTTDGIKTGTYTYSIVGSGNLFIPVYNNDTESYNLPPAGSVNKITISSVTDLRIKGEYELNLMDVVSQKKVKIVGTFDAAGKTETK